MEKSDDPRVPGGDISGPGGPFDKDGVVIDTGNAVLLDQTWVVQVNNPSDGRTFVGMQLGGRVNQSGGADRTRILYLFDADGAAALVSELIGLAGRSDAPWADEFRALLGERLAALPIQYGGTYNGGDDGPS